MEEPQIDNRGAERSRPASRLPPSPSKSSTTSSQPPQQTNSANSSSSQIDRSSRSNQNLHDHRYHHKNCGSSTGSIRDRPRPRPQASRESRDSRESRESREVPNDARSSATPVPTSSLLQERLQRERSSSRMSNDHSTYAGDGRTVQSSPARATTADGRRPRSSQGDPLKKKGLGLKEMEQTLSTLHKQNFDLKLELYHRRDRQSALEERAERAEREKVEVEEINDKLLAELEKRDKAVEEAVSMIVTLEARMEQLLEERDLVRRVEANGFAYHGSEQTTSGTFPDCDSTTKTGNATRLNGDKVVARMPSFLSDRSVGAENLRNVYLGVAGSLLSLPRTQEDGRENGARTDHQRARSPSLSMLSESSFLSVYGQKAPRITSDGRRNLDTPPSLDGLATNNSASTTTQSSPPRRQTSSRGERLGNRRPSLSRTESQGSSQYQNIGDVLNTGRSPLQKLEQLEKETETRELAPRSRGKEMTGGEGQSQRTTPSSRSRTRPRTKEEKREALRRVMTDAPAHALRHSNGLPPTPDTISTSTLRDMKRSNETMSTQPPLPVHDKSFLASSDATTYASNGRGNGALPGSTAGTTQHAPSTSAFTSRREFSGTGSYFDDRLHIPARPRSADETTVSNHRKNEWDSDSDEGDGAESRVSTYDYWMRESQKPNRFLNPPPAPRALDRDGRTSPDLFGFPASSGGWASNSMFGALGGNGFLGSNLAQSSALDSPSEPLSTSMFGFGLGSPVAGAAVAPPPPPNRRSSLHAQTGITSAGTFTSTAPTVNSDRASSMATSQPRISPQRKKLGRSNSTGGRPSSQGRVLNTNDPVMYLTRDLGPVPAPRSQYQPAVAHETQQKARHHPPVTGQVPGQAPASRAGPLKSLFRRSLGGGSSQPTSSTSTEATSGAKAAPPQRAPMIGVPSWGRRADLDDDRDSATPPPIMRNRVPGRDSLDGGDAMADARAAAGGVVSPVNGVEPVQLENGGSRMVPVQVARSMPRSVDLTDSLAGLNGNAPQSTGGRANMKYEANGQRTEASLPPLPQQQAQQQSEKRGWLGSFSRKNSVRKNAS